MGWSYRKSFKMIPGVRLTVSPRGVSTSVGAPGYRLTGTATGKVTRTISIPGTGISNNKALSAPASHTRRTAQPAATPASTAPGMFAPRWEKELYWATSKQNWSELPRIAHAYREATPVAVTMDAFLHLELADLPRTVELLRSAWAHAGKVENHEFVRKYLTPSRVTINIADGVQATLPICRDAVGLLLADVEQLLGNLNAAINVVEHLEPSHIAAVSLCELYDDVRRYNDVIEFTNGTSNEDDTTALLLTFRGIAFREQGFNTASLEAFKDALRSSKRHPAIRHRALIERAGTYLADGKKVQARRDLERVLAEDSTCEGVRGLLATLS